MFGKDKSKKERGLKKDMRLILVDYLRNKNQKIKRDDLLRLVNKTLEKSNQKKISLSSLKRYIEISKSMTNDDREKAANILRGEIIWIYSQSVMQ